MDTSSAKYAVNEKILDAVGMTRAHIADPYLVQKMMENREDDIRPCVGAGYCIDRIYVGLESLCIHNASTSREEMYPHEITKNTEICRNIVIIGGGIAGLECARICKIRGHNVTLYEANAKLGGQVLLASKANWRRDLSNIIDWRVNQCDKLGVTIHTQTYADYETIIEDNPDVVIIATGGIPNTDFMLDNTGKEYVNTVW
eukprot:CAMPEP_0114687004 /NCGR_PEP_ID=MMETSP0191-20121206/62054_1 /TAXON_ID=126664 /ORGANISM="Sorites sp." /LENGTH=200 /DNA_ID=CAMNT_0001973073 /DNA_START=421 /DNA_END=1020 /DNA_ORIENTATION=-